MLRKASHKYGKNRTTAQDAPFIKRLSGLTFGDSEKEGITKGRSFYHSDLNFKFTFPKGWLLSNQSSAVQVMAPSNAAFINLSMQDLNKRVTPQQFITTRMGIENILSKQAVRVPGYIGYSVVTMGKTPYGERKVRATVLINGKRAFIILGAVKKDNQFALFDRHILQTINSFSTLNKRDKLNAKELKIKVIKAGGSTRFSSLAKQSPISQYAEDQIRLLNGKYPNGHIKIGDLVKIVR